MKSMLSSVFMCVVSVLSGAMPQTKPKSLIKSVWL